MSPDRLNKLVKFQFHQLVQRQEEKSFRNWLVHLAALTDVNNSKVKVSALRKRNNSGIQGRWNEISRIALPLL